MGLVEAFVEKRMPVNKDRLVHITGAQTLIHNCHSPYMYNLFYLYNCHGSLRLGGFDRLLTCVLLLFCGAVVLCRDGNPCRTDGVLPEPADGPGPDLRRAGRRRRDQEVSERASE